MPRWRAVWVLVRFAYRADPWRATAVLVLTVVEMSALGLFALWLKFFADGAVRGEASLTMIGAVGMTTTIVVYEIANWLHYAVQETLRDKTSLEMDLHLMDLVGGVPSLEHHERADYARELELLLAQRGTLAQGVAAVAYNLGAAAQLVVAAVLLAYLHPLLLLLPLFAVPSLVVSSRAQRMRDETWDRTAEPNRTASHLFELASERAAAMEIRVFGLGGELRRRHEAARAQMAVEHDRTHRRAAALAISGWMVFAFGYVAAIVFVVFRAVRGLATVGDVLLAVNLAAQVSGQVSQAAGGATWLRGALKMGERYLWLVEHAGQARPKMEAPVPVPSRLREGIRVEGVSFTYPGTDRVVLSDVDMLLPAGRTVAFVGDNGAGKTTLVKLLLRFYDPTSGRIAVDGTDLRRLDPEKWRGRTSAAFQDFVPFEFLAGETVGVGDVERVDDESAILTALDRARSEDVLQSLPAGLHTQLGKRFDEGHDLSMGQWQKLALGRAMMRDAPLLLVLDEPTASLDPMTEHALFERYAAAAGRVGAERGAITVLVSHRFSTVRMADLIVVVDAGRVVEQGSHAELIALGGLYAELYELQARAYR